MPDVQVCRRLGGARWPTAPRHGGACVPACGADRFPLWTAATGLLACRVRSCRLAVRRCSGALRAPVAGPSCRPTASPEPFRGSGCRLCPPAQRAKETLAIFRSAPCADKYRGTRPKFSHHRASIMFLVVMPNPRKQRKGFPTQPSLRTSKVGPPQPPFRTSSMPSNVLQQLARK